MANVKLQFLVMGDKGDVCQAELREKAMAAHSAAGLLLEPRERRLVGNST